MRIAILGGGPGGLFAATLAKASDATREVTVFERNRPEDTFGFGVVFSDATLEAIHAADPVLRRALDDHGVHWDPIEVRLRAERLVCRGNGMAAIERRTLLRLLQRRAEDAGVELRFSAPVDPGHLASSGYDLVVAADGASSLLRERYSAAFEPTVETSSTMFIWLGTTYLFDGLTFVHEQGPHGVFSVHGYPIGDDLSTFIVETDAQTWRTAGFEELGATVSAPQSDERSRTYLEALFAEQIDGHRLLANRSRWSRFRTRRARHWRHRVGDTAIALLGDAAHTAHFSVGSGTKMAMEDAVALVAALDAQPGDVDAALASYEAARQPEVAKIQGSARPSLSWWEHVGRSYASLPPWQFAYHFFTRSLSEAKLRRRDERFVREAHDRWRRVHGAEPLQSPIEIAAQRLTQRVITVSSGAAQLPSGPLPLLAAPAGSTTAWGLGILAPDDEDRLPTALDAVAKGVKAGAALVAVGGGTALSRRLVSEAARLELGATTLLVEPHRPAGGAHEDDVATTAVLSGRADLVAFAENVFAATPCAGTGASA